MGKISRKSMSAVLIVLGTACISLGLLLLADGRVSAQTSPGDDYAGLGECNDCHRRVAEQFKPSAHAMAAFEPEDFPEAVIADFAGNEAARLFQFPDEEAPRPFTLEDVAFVVGTGEVAQRYVIEAEDRGYRVLPVEWNVEAGTWQTFPLPNGDDWGENCASCHTTGYDPATHSWVDEAVTCESCHGPGLSHIEAADDAGSSTNDEELGLILAAITTNPDPETCGSCHTTWTEVEACEDPVHCGGMAFDKWLSSPHAQMVSAEGGEDQTGGETYVLACAGCHVVHGDDQVVPNLLISEGENTCLTCHEDSGADALLRGDQFVENIEGIPSAHFEEGLTCESCHDIHAVHSIPLGRGAEVTCTACHSDLTPGTLRDFAADAQSRVADRLLAIKSELNSSAPEWVHTVVSVVENDGSSGIHNFAYVSRLLNAVETELGILEPALAETVPLVTASDPIECAECHADVHSVWATSPHANASLSETFQQAHAENGRPSYCMSCHASGFNPATQEYIFEGVVCSTCHTEERGEHPPSPMTVADSAQSCGRCHSGEHSPEYNEWLVSEHRAFNVDCVDCHLAHDNSLRLGDINTTCGSCHENAMNDEVHMGEDMTCVDCHMSRTHEDGIIIQHTMFFDPETCAECHGDIHNLQLDPAHDLSETEKQVFASMQEEIGTLETRAETNLQSGIVGGAVGAMVLVGILFLALRIGKMR